MQEILLAGTTIFSKPTTLSSKDGGASDEDNRQNC
jgi:hypothetical protein